MSNPTNHERIEYAGFWIRTGASLLDTLLVMIVTFPLLSVIYGDAYWSGDQVIAGGWDALISYVFPAVAVILFWHYRSATPGKMAFRLVIMDAHTGQKPSTGQYIGRYFAYIIALLPLFLGVIWVGIDRRKQGWHDKLAGTVVVQRPKKSVQFTG